MMDAYTLKALTEICQENNILGVVHKYSSYDDIKTMFKDTDGITQELLTEACEKAVLEGTELPEFLIRFYIDKIIQRRKVLEKIKRIFEILAR